MYLANITLSWGRMFKRFQLVDTLLESLCTPRKYIAGCMANMPWPANLSIWQKFYAPDPWYFGNLYGSLHIYHFTLLLLHWFKQYLLDQLLVLNIVIIYVYCQG